jgi:hypothetical protein
MAGGERKDQLGVIWFLQVKVERFLCVSLQFGHGIRLRRAAGQFQAFSPEAIAALVHSEMVNHRSLLRFG